MPLPLLDVVRDVSAPSIFATIRGVLPGMEEQLTLSIYRRLDNRAEGLSDQSPRAVELHRLRAAALHEVLDDQPGLHVVDWDKTDNAEPHELVTIVIAVVGPFLVSNVVTPALKALVDKLAEKSAGGVVDWLVSKLRKKQVEKKVLDFDIRLPDGTVVHVDSPERTGEIQVRFKDGRLERLTVSATDV